MREARRGRIQGEKQVWGSRMTAESMRDLLRGVAIAALAGAVMAL